MSTQEQWTAVDSYITDLLVPADTALEATLKASDSAGLPSISVTPNQGKLLQLLARLKGARTILEIGTLGGYSTIWLSRALPVGGRMITLELEPKHADLARANLARAGLEGIAEVRLGPAIEALAQLYEERERFDFIFIDADKPSNANYLEWAIKLARRGTLIVVDNVVRKGEVLDANSNDPNVRGTRRLYEQLSSDTRLSATAIQTVGSKGHDGFVVALVTSRAGLKRRKNRRRPSVEARDQQQV